MTKFLMIGRVMNSLFSLQSVFENGVKNQINMFLLFVLVKRAEFCIVLRK